MVLVIAWERSSRHALGQLLVCRRDHSALADAQLLLGEEAEGPQLSDRSDLASGVVDVGADRLCAVLDQREVVLVAQLAQREHIGGIAAEVHRDDRAGTRGDPAGHVVGIDVEVPRAAHIAQDRLSADVARGARASDEREAGHDHLVAGPDPCCKQRQVQRGRAVGHGHCVRTADIVGKRVLEGLCARTHRQPSRGQAVEHGLHILLGHRDVGQRDAPVVHGATASASAAATRS